MRVLLECGGVTEETLCVWFPPEPLGQILIDITTVADGHRADDSSFRFNGIHNTKATNAVLSQPVQFPLERASAFRVGRYGSNSCLDQLLEIRMEPSDHLGRMRRNVRAEGDQAVRRFLTGVRGSPNTSSNESPVRLVL